MIDPSEEIERRSRLIDALADEFTLNDVLTRDRFSKFDFGYGPERLLDINRGIWNPKKYSGTLTIINDPEGPYDDKFQSQGLFAYAYQKVPVGQDPLGGPNAKLRTAMKLELPIIMLRKISPGKFVPIMPVYVVADDEENRRFLLALDESLRFIKNPSSLTEDQRRYAERTTKQRLHQAEFRSKVMHAYKQQCAICSLKQPKLLDAAHIIDDSHDDGLAIVPNGLSLCKIHHTAFDKYLLGISPDYVVHINDELLNEVDGPMLKHGLQEMNSRKLWLPKRASEQPDRDRLAMRFEKFQNAS